MYIWLCVTFSFETDFFIQSVFLLMGPGYTAGQNLVKIIGQKGQRQDKKLISGEKRIYVINEVSLLVYLEIPISL